MPTAVLIHNKNNRPQKVQVFQGQTHDKTYEDAIGILFCWLNDHQQELTEEQQDTVMENESHDWHQKSADNNKREPDYHNIEIHWIEE